MPFYTSHMRHLLIYLLFLSCNQTQEKIQQTANFNAKNKADSFPYIKSDSLRIDTFSIATLIPEFLKDANFRNISGAVVGMDIQQIVYYSIYRLPKKNVFKALKNNNQDTKLSGKKQIKDYTGLVKIDSVDFFKKIYRDYKKNTTAQNFYDKLKSLKGYDIYFASTYGYMHWLFFDKNSDTVYQRTQLFTY